MSAADKPPVASISDCTLAFTVSDALHDALLALCESRGWSADTCLCNAIEYGVRCLQGGDDASYEQIALLRAENARLCAENAQLHDWIDQCQDGAHPVSQPTMRHRRPGCGAARPGSGAETGATSPREVDDDPID